MSVPRRDAKLNTKKLCVLTFLAQWNVSYAPEFYNSFKATRLSVTQACAF